MTDRDTFAAAALTGLLASGEFDGVPTHYSPATGHAYAWADAMIRERQGRSRLEDTPTQDDDGAVREIEMVRLTDEECQAIYRAEARLRAAYVPDDKTAATLRKLLARLA